ncbi:MAG: hypothetical protein AAF708_19825 [Deinococcota bacterium]
MDTRNDAFDDTSDDAFKDGFLDILWVDFETTGDGKKVSNGAGNDMAESGNNGWRPAVGSCVSSVCVMAILYPEYLII